LQVIKEAKLTTRLSEVFSTLQQLGVPNNQYEFSPTLARGMDYYTGIILEVEVEEYTAGSLGGGGRYDNLIGLFANKQIPAVGFAFGFDRLIEAMEELNLFPKDLQITKVLVTIFSKELQQKSIDCASVLRSAEVSAEIYLDPDAKIEKQLKYADRKQIPFVVIIGPDEAKNNTVTVKNLKIREQKTIPTNQLPDLFKQ
jgi:histidyl-tRNA synthetase